MNFTHWDNKIEFEICGINIFLKQNPNTHNHGYIKILYYYYFYLKLFKFIIFLIQYY